MFKQLQHVYATLKQYNTDNITLLTERWRGHIYLDLPCTNYEQWLQKIAMATKNYCIVVTRVPLQLLDHTTLYNFVFFQSQLIIFCPDKHVLCISGFYKPLATEQFTALFDLGKVYVNATYKKLHND